MENEFSEKLLREQLNKLELWKRLVFLLAICERMLPNFILFASETGANGSDTLRSALNMAWDIILNHKFPVDLSLEAKQCEDVAPDTEDYSCLLVSSALDAALGISNLMKAVTEYDNEYVVESAILICDSIDMYVQEIEKMDSQDPDLEQKITVSKLMQKELRIQRESIEYLSGLDKNLKFSKNEIKRKWFDIKESCLSLHIGGGH